jgi:hypothetical protein
LMHGVSWLLSCFYQVQVASRDTVKLMQNH